MSNSSLYLAAAVIFLTSLQSAVHAQPFCLKRGEMVKQLKEQFHEIPISIGIVGNSILEIFSAPNGKTFTIVFTTKEGITCPITSGKNFINLPAEPKEGLDIINPRQSDG
jgi:hypothetical protein